MGAEIEGQAVSTAESEGGLKAQIAEGQGQQAQELVDDLFVMGILLTLLFVNYNISVATEKPSFE